MNQWSPMPVLRPDGPVSSLEVDFSLALLSVIESARKDPAQLRHMVYELARVQLGRELRTENPDGKSSVSACEIPRLMLAFEAAIGHVERFSCKQDELPHAPGEVGALHRPGCTADAMPYQLHQPSERYQARQPCE